MGNVVPIVSAVFLVILILFYNNVTCAVEGAIMSVFSPGRAREMMEDSFFKRSCIISFIISVPLFSFCLTTCGVSHFSLTETILIFVILFVVRYLSDVLLSTFDDGYKVLEETRYSNFTFVIITLASIPALIYTLVTGFSYSVFPDIWIGVVASIFVIVRLFTVLRKFLSLKFSHFFTFLYLCGLKILPIAVAVKVFVN